MSNIDQQHPLARSFVRIFNLRKDVKGAGFLIADRIICTCAHVVAAATGCNADDKTRPGSVIHLDFPFLIEHKEQDPAEPDQNNLSSKLEAHIIAWKPLKRDDDSGDIAILALSSEPPAGAASARLLSFLSLARLEGRLVDIYGFPTNYEHAGLWTSDYRLDKPLTNGLLQMTGTTALGIDIRPGNSGAPVWDKENEGVVGMVSTRAGGSDVDNRVAFLIPNSLIVELHSPLQASLQVLSTAPDWVRYAIHNLGYRFESDELIILADLFWACPYAREKENWQNAREIDDMLDAVYDLDYATHPGEVQALEAYINKILPLGGRIDRSAVRELIRLLRQVSWDGQLLTVLFKECRPSVGFDLPDHSEADRLLIAIVRNLARFDVQGEQDKWHPLLKFPYLLERSKLSTSSPQEQQIASYLRTWINRQASILKIPSPESQSRIQEDNRVRLSVLIRHNTQSDLENLHHSTFWVSAWLIPVDKRYNSTEISRCASYKLEALPEALRNILHTHAREHNSWTIAAIELSVPWMLLFCKLEQKQVVARRSVLSSSRSKSRPLAADYPVVFRLNERSEQAEVVRDAWHDKWKKYHSWRHDPLLSSDCNSEDEQGVIICFDRTITRNFDDLYGTLGQSGVFGTAYTFPMTNNFKDDLPDEEIGRALKEAFDGGDETNLNMIDAVIQTGIPIAFFARGMTEMYDDLHKSLQQLIQEREPHKWLQLGDIFEFGRNLKKYYMQHTNLLGKHLVVLWDDPDSQPFDDPLDDTGIV